MATPYFSLVLATRNRSTALRRALRSIGPTKDFDVEIIVVDQSDDDSSASVVSSDSNGAQVLYVRSAGRGLSLARNEGLQIARGNVIGFPDDDCEYSTNLLSNVYREFERARDLGFVSGRYVASAEVAEMGMPLQVPLNCWNAFRYVNSITLFVRATTVGRRQIVFRKELGAGTAMPLGEETDLALRLLRQGNCGMWSSELVAYHPPTTKSARLEDRIRIETAYGYLIGVNSDSHLVRMRAALGFTKLGTTVLVGKERAEALRARRDGFLKGRMSLAAPITP